jgi:hypothetical protein
MTKNIWKPEKSSAGNHWRVVNGNRVICDNKSELTAEEATYIAHAMNSLQHKLDNPELYIFKEEMGS